MSRDAEDRLPPRRRKPPGDRPSSPRPGGPGSEPNVWKPSPTKASSSRTCEKPVAFDVKPGMWERVLFGRVNSGLLAAFCRQFASYLDAGVDILKALSSLESQFARTALGPVIGRLSVGVHSGESFDEVVAREPPAFDPRFLSMVKVAEARGGLPETLRVLARHYEFRERLIRQARSALIYPSIVLIIASGVVALLTTWLLPMFTQMLKDIAGPNVTLPFPSRALLWFSGFVQGIGWWLFPLVLFGGPFLIYRLYKTSAGRRAMDELVLYVPVLGLLLWKLDTTRFARTLATLLGSGVDIGTSLALTSEVVQLSPIRQILRGARTHVMEGGELGEALATSHRFGADVIAVVNTGEETGMLPEALERLADSYEEQVSHMVRNLGQLVQPLLLIFLGGVVLFIILAVLLPYINMLTSLAR